MCGFRVVQEIVSNIIRHAHARMIDLNLRITDSHLSLRIEDDGIGFDTKKKTKGLGQKNIELRIQMLKGKYRFQSSPEKGTTFLLHIPV
jgi:signal transduction histidine kinase